MVTSAATLPNTDTAENDIFIQDTSSDSISWSDKYLLSTSGKARELPQARYKKVSHELMHTIDTVGSFVDYSYPIPAYEANTPFGQLFALEADQRKDLIEKIKNIPLPYVEKVYYRLNNLEKASEEEFPNTKLISVDSLYGFKKFLDEFGRLNLKYPDITLTPLGNIRIQWQPNKEHYLSVEFISNQEVKIVLFTPDSNIIGKISRISAKMPIVSTFDNLQPYKVLTWISE